MLRFSSRLRFLMARAGVRRATEDLRIPMRDGLMLVTLPWEHLEQPAVPGRSVPYKWSLAPKAFL